MSWAYSGLLLISAHENSTAAYEVAADAGAFAVTGQDVTFQRALVMEAEPGIFTLSGQDMLPQYSEDAAPSTQRSLSLSLSLGL